jgi:hypothetical protein
LPKPLLGVGAVSAKFTGMLLLQGWVFGHGWMLVSRFKPPAPRPSPQPLSPPGRGALGADTAIMFTDRC